MLYHINNINVIYQDDEQGIQMGLGEKMKNGREREKIRKKGEETPQKFPSLLVQNRFFWEGGNNMIHLHNI